MTLPATRLPSGGDREEIQAEGWEPFDPRGETSEFLRLLVKGSGRSLEDIFFDPASGGSKGFGQVYTEQLQDPAIMFDLNGDGTDPGHCVDLAEAFAPAAQTISAEKDLFAPWTLPRATPTSPLGSPFRTSARCRSPSMWTPPTGP